MSKITCEICGTTYEDSESSCPVCGWNADGNADLDVEDLDLGLEEETPKAAPVKAQRPVKQPAKKAAEEDDDDDDDDEEEESGSNKFLVVILVLLILALLAVSLYIGWTKIIKPKMGGEENKPVETVTAQIVDSTEQTGEVILPDETTEPVVSGVPCTNLAMVHSLETMVKAGEMKILTVKATPNDTTDPILYSSANEEVAKVNADGLVTAIGEGKTVIIVSCGDKRVEVPVTVDFSAEKVTAVTTPTTAPQNKPAETTTNNNTAATSSNGSFKLKKSDVTIGRQGVYIVLEAEGGISADQIKWSTSDSYVANVYNGAVTALHRGTCVITAEYNGEKAQCIVRCKF